MRTKRTLRLLALMLSVLLILQCAAAAADPAAPEDPESTVQEPVESAPEGEAPGEEAPGEEVPENIVITASLADGQVVNNPRQSLSVEAVCGQSVLDPAQITVTLNGAAVTLDADAYALKLEPGDNTLVITAASGEQSQTLTLCVRYEIVIPSGWAYNALRFCVEHGILKGDQNGDLKATDNATRAELAAMLVRLFGAQKLDALTAFTDVPEKAWYHDEMAKAVAMGIYKGSGSKLNPTNRITREEAFVVLARAFGVTASTTEALNKAPDKDQVSAWARYNVAGMLESGLVNGYSDGSLKPKGYITRQELAQVLYNALDCITDDPEALTGTRCLYTGPASALEGRKIDGSLIISCPDTENLTLNDLSVAGRLVLHLHEVDKAVIGTDAETVSLCSPTELTLTNPVKTINCLRDGGSLRANAELAIIDANAVLHGNYDEVFCLTGGTIAADAKVSELEAVCNITVDGTVDELHARRKCSAIQGSGSIGTLYKYTDNLTVSPSVGKTVDRVDAGLSGVKITSGPAPDVYYDIPTVKVTGTVSGVNTTQVFGVPDGVRICTVTYRYNGKVLKTDKNFRLVEGATLSCEVTPKHHYMTAEEQSVSVTISYQDQTVTGALKMRTLGMNTPLKQAEGIRTAYVNARVLRTTTVYAYSSLSGYVTTIYAGDVVHFIKSNGSTSLVETEDGSKRGWVSDSALQISWRTYHNDSVEYTKEAKEAFVNQLHDYSSSTNYLVWANLYTTTVNIFQGSKGNWKLIMSGECTIGAPNTPTRPGVYSIYSKTRYWSFNDDATGRTDVSRCNYVSLFDGGIAFHSRLYYSGTSTFYGNSSLSAELSHGCIRCPDEIAIFIYNNCPIGTRVVVY